jgi:hypothetical protein
VATAARLLCVQHRTTHDTRTRARFKKEASVYSIAAAQKSKNA